LPALSVWDGAVPGRYGEASGGVLWSGIDTRIKEVRRMPVFVATTDLKTVFSVVFMKNLVYLTCDS